MNRYQEVKKELMNSPKTWLITGVAGFIGSNLLESLLKLNQTVVGLDDFSTGFEYNLKEVEEEVGHLKWENFNFIKGNICNLDDCRKSVSGVDYVLHQAALGSVPRSIDNPIATNETNISGFLNMLVAAKDEKVKSFIYAASSSTYGDHPALPKVEQNIGKPLSPYAVTKYVNEVYADVFASTYNFNAIGLRYFNVFGKRQNPNGAYAAVIPKWVSSIIKEEDVFINGDGLTSRDFCYIENTIQMNLLAAVNQDENAVNQVYNTALSDRTTLNDLYEMISNSLVNRMAGLKKKAPLYRDFREGDVRHSQADITKAKEILGYAPTHRVVEGLDEAMGWYIDFCLSE